MWFLPLIGMGLSGAGGASQTNEEMQALQDEAAISEKNALLARQAAKYDAYRQSIMAKQQIGQIESDYGASGISSDSGSVLDVLRQSHVNAELDRQAILYGGELKAQDMMQRAQSARAGRDNLKKNRGLKIATSMFNSGQSLSRYAGGGGRETATSAAKNGNISNASAEYRRGNLRYDSDFNDYGY